MPARVPEQVDYLLAEAFNAQDLDACVALHDPKASVVRLDVYGGMVAKGDQGIREVMSDYVRLKPHTDAAIHHVAHRRLCPGATPVTDHRRWTRPGSRSSCSTTRWK